MSTYSEAQLRVLAKLADGKPHLGADLKTRSGRLQRRLPFSTFMRLMADGLIKQGEEGSRSRRTYTITDAGLAEHRRHKPN